MAIGKVVGDCTVGSGDEKGIDIFPYDFLVLGHFEYPPRRTFADQRIAVGLPLGAADRGAIKGQSRVAHILPSDLIGAWVHLYDPGIAGPGTVKSIVEDQYPAVV